MPDDNHPMLAHPSEPWFGSPVEPTFQRLDLSQQLATARRPELFVHGDAINGWSVRDTQPDYDNLTWGGQNFLRARLNDLENPRGLLGDNQAYIDEVQDLISAGRGEFKSWENSEDALKQFIPFLPDAEADLAPTLEQVDPQWNGLTEWDSWRKQYPEVAEYLTTVRGVVPEDAFSGTRNRDAFMLVINMEMTKAKIQQEIDEYERTSGTLERWSQFVAGGAFRQLVLDSDAAKTFALGAAGKGVGAVASTLRGAQFVSKAPLVGKALALFERAGTVGQSTHRLLSETFKLGTAGALAVEGAATAAVWDAQHQNGMNNLARWLGQSGMEYDYTETLQAGGLGALFGLGAFGAIKVLGGLANGVARKPGGARAALAAAGMEDQPIARHGLTPEGLTLQRMEEDGIVKINRTLAQVADDRLGFVLSKDVIEAAGRTVPEVGTFVDSLMALRRRGVRISDEAMLEVVDDFLDQGPLKNLTPSERMAYEKAVGREHALRVQQANPEWRAQMEAEKAQLQAALSRPGAVTQPIADRIAEIDSLLTKPADPESAGMYALRDNPIAAASVAQAYQPVKAASKLVAQIRQQLSAIDEAKTLGGETSKNAQKAARDEIRRLTATLNAKYGKPPEVPKVKAQKVPSAKALDRMKPAEQQKFLGDVIDNLESSPNEVMQATTLMSKALKVVGYEGPLKKYLLSRTGIYSTARSQHKVIRAAMALFGSPDFNSRVFAGRGGAGTGVVAALGRAERDVAPIKSFLEDFANRKGMTSDRFAEFNNTVESAMNRKGKMPAGHPFEQEGNKLIGLWQRHVDDVIARGKRTRSIRPSKEMKVSTFLPLVTNEPYLRANFKQAASDLASVWQRQAQRSEFLNPEYLEQLGWIERPIDKYGNRVGKLVYKSEGPLGKFEGKSFPKRTDLTPEALAEYVKKTEDPAALHGAAELYWTRFLREDARGADVRSVNDKVYGSNSRNPHKRKITQQMLEEFPELKQYFNRDLFTLFDKYAKTAGFKAHVGESIQRAYGVNATLGQMMNALEAKMKYAFKGDLPIQKEITEAWDKAHEMVAWLGGYLPDIDPSYASWSKFTADSVQKAGFLLTAGGMGIANGYEALTKMFLMVHNPADLGRNMKALIRGLFSNRAVQREELAGLAHDSRRMAVGYSHQLFSGRMDYAYELTTKGVLTRPWKDAWATATGKIAPIDAPGRVSATALATLDALGKTAYLAGATPRITHATEIMVNGAVQREFMRYSDALLSLREAMRVSPIDPSDPGALKAFQQAARKAGFGDRWDLAEKLIRWDLDADTVKALQKAAATVGVHNKIHVRLPDLMEAYQKMPLGPERDALYESIQRYGQYVDDRIGEELAETSAWSARTDAKARTHWGRALDMFSSYMHNTYFHKLGKSAAMPSRAFLGTVTGLVVAELLQSVTQDYLNGQSVEDIEKRWDTPEEALLSSLSTAMRIPMFGSVSFIPKYIADSAIDTYNQQAGNDSINAYAPKFGGVVGSSIDSIYRLGKGANQWAFGLTPDYQDRGRKTFLSTGTRFLPIINSGYGKLGIRMFTDWRERQSRGFLRSVSPVGDGRSIWGDEDAIHPSTPAQVSPPPPAEFDLAKALTTRK